MGLGPEVAAVGTGASEQVAVQLASWRTHGWELLRDVHRPGRTGDVLEHVAVGPGGVLVVDVGGVVTGAVVTEAVVTGPVVSGVDDAPSRTPHPEDVAVMAASISALLDPAHRTAVHGAVALVDRRLPAMVVDAGTVVVGLLDLDAWRASLPLRLLPVDVAAVTGRLRAMAGPCAPAVQLTLHDVVPAARHA